MVEKLQGNSPESARNAAELEAAGAERRAELERQSVERSAEKSSAEKNRELESAKHEALELARDKEAEKEAKTNEQESREIKRTTRPSKGQLDESFKSSMEHIRKDMSPASRTFSKVIHNPAVDAVSNVVGSTIARPNLIIAGGISTLIFCSAIYLIAKQYGYGLSGFEAIGTFVVGWAIGAVIEYARVGLINQKRR